MYTVDPPSLDQRREEEDLLGKRFLPSEALWGIHTLRAQENFPIALRPIHPELIHAFGWVKLACTVTNIELGVWRDDVAKGAAIEAACRELAAGDLDAHIVVDAMQGGAGTSTNMNVNEVIANRALQHLGLPLGSYQRISPLDDINRHQSTNDTYPTALRLAIVRSLRTLETEVVALQEAFQAAERRFADVVKVGRTQLQDAVLMTLGQEMSAYAEAINRDRWRLYKCEERLRVVNLGGTAIGTGIGAPRDFIFRVVDKLRELCGVGFARAENLVEATQNADVFVEVSGMLKAYAASLMKMANDLRLLGSGPQAGIGELILPPRQAGSSIMPGKVNPVMPEAVVQVAMRVMGYDVSIAFAAASGNLELNAFLPLIADCLLSSIDLLRNVSAALRENCIAGITANLERCRAGVDASTALATALVPHLGYERASAVAKEAHRLGRSVRQHILDLGLLSAEEIAQTTAPEAVIALGHR